MFIRASLALLKCFGCFGPPYMAFAIGVIPVAIMLVTANVAKPWSVLPVKAVVIAIAIPDTVPGTPQTSQYLWKNAHQIIPR